jgi:fatty acid amide hydrolase 2
MSNPNSLPTWALWEAPLATLRQWLVEGRTTPTELVAAHVDRIEQVNPALNALVANRFAEARTEASAADGLYERARAKGTAHELPPLLGIPCTIKEFFGVEGAPNTAGSMLRVGRTADQDAPTVARLRQAGAIILGLSNIPEGGLWMETFNKVYGLTRNPWNLTRSPGGSSGGEAALISAGASPFGLGADFAGSIRIPANFCGIAGHKPTAGLIPTTGHHPMPSGSSRKFMVAGPLARFVADLHPLLKILAGADGQDPFMYPERIDYALRDPATIDVKGLRVMAFPHVGPFPVDPAVREAVFYGVGALEKAGAKVEGFDDPRLRRAFLYWSALLNEYTEQTYAVSLGEGDRVHLARELGRALVGRSKHTLVPLVISIAEELAAKVPMDPKLVAEGEEIKHALEKRLGPDGVLIAPVWSRPAPRHYTPILRPFDAGFSSLISLFEMPSTAVRTGFDDKRSVPLGVQVIGARFEDAVTLAASAVIEQAAGGFHMAHPPVA